MEEAEKRFPTFGIDRLVLNLLVNSVLRLFDTLNDAFLGCNSSKMHETALITSLGAREVESQYDAGRCNHFGGCLSARFAWSS
jgi:hypothetical protein